jgi:hypothetical protein
MGIQLSDDEARGVVRSLDLVAYQVKELSIEIGSHNKQFADLQTQVGEIKLAMALLTQSKTRTDLSIQSLPDYIRRVDFLFDDHKRMQNNMDSIRNQAWGGFLSAIGIAIAGWIFVAAQAKPVKAIDVEAFPLAHRVDPHVSQWRKL